MIQIAILGYGVVGSGVAEVLKQNQAQIHKKVGNGIEVKHVLDRRDFLGDPVEKLLTKDYAVIENDPDVKIVVEAMGGVEVAYDYTKRALLKGKCVCTSNKALIAKHGAELLAIAKEKDINILFEASVGGGIPLIRPFNHALITDQIIAIAGILNGTSNYILTQMSTKGTEYDVALASAQKLGYAEQDPTADVGSYDACRKLAILLSLGLGKQVDFEDILTEGISEIDAADFAFAHGFGFTLKPMVEARIGPDGVEALASPLLVSVTHPLSTVSDVFNGVMVKGKTTDYCMFYGQGAGKLPTASAMVSDIVDAAKHLTRHIPHAWSDEKTGILPPSGYVKRKVIRVSSSDPATVIEQLPFVTKEAQVLELPGYPNQLAWLTLPETEQETEAALEKIRSMMGVDRLERVLRVYDPV